MKGFIYLLALGVCLSSCVSTKKYAAYVDQKVKVENTEVVPNEWLTVNTPISEQKGNNYTQVKSMFFPAIFYWAWNSTIACDMDPNFTATYIKKGIYQAADSLDLQSKLQGKKLVIDLKQTPGKFLYENKGNAVILVVAHVSTSVEAISPYPVHLMLNYQLTEDGAVVAQGETTVQNREEPVINKWKSTKKFTWLYLDQLEKEAQRMGVESVKDIIRQLESEQSSS